MITLTVQELIESIPVLRELGGKQLRSKTAFRVARLMREVQKESDAFEEQRIALVRKYGAKDENGNLSVDENGNNYIEPEHVSDFNSELTELLNNTITVSGDKLNLDDLGDETFTPAQMLNFSAFLEE